MALLEKEKAENKCIICRDQLKSSGGICNSCYDAMRLGKPFRKKK